MEKNRITTEELNAVYGAFVSSYIQPIKIDMSSGVTAIPKDNFGAFELNRPSSKNIKLEPCKSGGVIVRYAFGQQFANETFRDYHKAIRFISVIQNEMLLAISHWIDWSKNPKVLFERPGQPGIYFTELESYAGFEIRAYYDGSN